MTPFQYLDQKIHEEGTFSPQQHNLARHIYRILKEILPPGNYHTKQELLDKLKQIGTTHDERKVMEVARKLRKLNIVGEYDGVYQAVELG